MNTLNLTHVHDAFTIDSADDDMRSSEKGLYLDRAVAEQRAKKSGWCGSDGTVIHLKDVWVDDNGTLYRVKKVGLPTDVAEEKVKKMDRDIRAKLTPEEMAHLGLK